MLSIMNIQFGKNKNNTNKVKKVYNQGTIITACEFLRSSSFVLKNKNKNADDNNEKNINYNSNRTKKEIKQYSNSDWDVL